MSCRGPRDGAFGQDRGRFTGEGLPWRLVGQVALTSYKGPVPHKPLKVTDGRRDWLDLAEWPRLAGAVDSVHRWGQTAREPYEHQ